MSTRSCARDIHIPRTVSSASDKTRRIAAAAADGPPAVLSPRWRPPVAVQARRLERPAGERAERGHVLHHSGVWSPDSTWIVYDTRGDAAGDVFDGAEIQAVNARTREVRTLFTASNGAKCGMASFNPVPHKREIVFTLGPENPTGAWTHAPHRAPRRARRLLDGAQVQAKSG